jgi:hypothetical protein
MPGLVRPGDLDQYRVSRTSVMAKYFGKYDREATETEEKEQNRRQIDALRRTRIVVCA